MTCQKPIENRADKCFSLQRPAKSLSVHQKHMIVERLLTWET